MMFLSDASVGDVSTPIANLRQPELLMMLMGTDSSHVVVERHFEARAQVGVLISSVVKATQDAVKAWSNA